MSFINRLHLTLAGAALSLFISGCATNPNATGLSGQDNLLDESSNDIVMVDNTGAAHAIYDDGLDLNMARADIWQRIRAGYIMEDLQTATVTDKEQWYLARPNYFKNTSARASLYLYYILEEIEKRNMPTELALLPFIESSFNPQAVSSAQAAGMWQFIPSTGKNFSLRQDMFRDERRDVIASTNAALDYMQKLYDMFGDWHLALAAYNSGEGTVLKAIQKNQKKGKPIDYASLDLPKETKNYVPMLQALKNIVGNPLGYKVELPLIANHPFFQTIAIERDMDVELVAKFAGITVEEFNALNPAVNKPVILVEIVPQILLPWDNAETFIQELKSYRGQLCKWTVWRAPQNMSVADVAAQTNMPESVLRSVNEIPPSVQVKKGSVLLVHRTQKSHTANVNLALLENASLEFVKTPNDKGSKSGKRRTSTSKIAVSQEAKQKVAGGAGVAVASNSGKTKAGSTKAGKTAKKTVAQNTAKRKTTNSKVTVPGHTDTKVAKSTQGN